jgi:membrane protein YdbS with pleckstrin-like domain
MIEEERQPLGHADWAGAGLGPQSPAGGFMALDPRVINLWRVSALIGIGLLLLVLLGGGVFVWMRAPRYLPWFSVGWLALAALFAGLLVWYPPLYYRSWGYRIDARVLETRSGRLIQRTRLLPLSRMQHVDIHRGPLDRLFGLASLILHTAGTHSANIQIPGLEAGEATRLRDRLIEIGGDDAV